MKSNDYKKYYDSYDATRMFMYALIFPYLGVFLLYMIYTMIGSSINITPKEFYDLLPILMINAVIMQVCFVVVFFVFNHKRKINFITATKLNKKTNAWVIAIALCMGFAVLWFSSPLITMFEKGLEAIGFEIKSDLGFNLDNAGTIIFALIGLGLLPAFIEEFIFRGAILQGLRKHGDWFAIIVSALLFMLIHANIQQTFYQFGFGLLAGWLVVKTGTIWVSILIHALNNCFIVTLTAIEDCSNVAQEVVKIDTPFILKTILYIAILAGLLWLGIYLIKRILKKEQQEVKPIEQSKNNKKEKKQFVEAEDGSRQMTLKDGFNDYFGDKIRKRDGLLTLFLAVCMFVINSVAMLM